MVSPRDYADISIQYTGADVKSAKNLAARRGVLTEKFTSAAALFAQFDIRLNMQDMAVLGQSIAGTMPKALMPAAQNTLAKHGFDLRPNDKMKAI